MCYVFIEITYTHRKKRKNYTHTHTYRKNEKEFTYTHIQEKFIYANYI